MSNPKIKLDELYRYPIGTQIELNSTTYTYLGTDPFDDMATFSDGYTILYEDDLPDVSFTVLPVNLTALIQGLTILLLEYLEFPEDNKELISKLKDQIIILKTIHTVKKGD